MLFSDRPRTHYEKTLAHEVICQLRFPTILSINNVEPADFQERIREDFPSTPGSRTFCLPRSSTVSQSLSLPSPTTTSSLRTADGS